MSLLPCVTAGMLGWGIVLLSTPVVLKGCGRLNRCRGADLHHSPRSAVSRLGGLSLAAAYFGIECVIFLAGEEEIQLNSFLLTSSPLAMFALGFWDDLKRLGAITKLAWQLLIASAVSLSGVCIQCLELPGFAGNINGDLWETILTIVWLITCTNAINLVDGVDGLAGSIGLILMVLMVCLSQGPQMCLTIGMAGALLAFLWFNLAPARVYLGDGGAYFIGFQVGLFSILASQPRSDSGPLVLVLLGLTLPLLDTALAFTRRGLRGLPFFRPDRNHLHHYLLETGMGPRRLVGWYSGFTLVLVGLGSLVTLAPRRWLVPLLLVVGLALAIVLWRLALTLGGRKTLFSGLKSSVAMRREIAYALSLRNWLKHEAERCGSVEDLFADLKLAARRLGFTSVQLALADGTRGWKQQSICGPLFAIRHSLQGGALGVLELEAPRCQFSLHNAAAPFGRKNPCGLKCQPSLNDVRLIRILSELLAESWVEATQVWPGKAHLRFDHELPATLGIPRRGLPINPAQRRGSDPDLRPEPRLATRAPGFLRRAFAFSVCAMFLGADVGMGTDLSSSALLQDLVGISRVELPVKAANLVQSAKSTERPQLTRELIRAVSKIGAAVVPAVVGSISKTTPQMAALAAGEAAHEQPAQASVIARAAATAAPAQTKAILLAVFRAVPDDYRKVALSVEQVVPGSSNQILEALAFTLPNLRNGIPTNTAPGGMKPALATIIDPTPGWTSPRPALVHREARTASHDPLVRRPTVGPPFVPVSGALTNLSPSTSRTVPPGGRNYAKP